MGLHYAPSGAKMRSAAMLLQAVFSGWRIHCSRRMPPYGTVRSPLQTTV